MSSKREHPPVAVIASGSGRYGDPWHPFAETSAAIAALLEADGWRVTVDDDVDLALGSLDGVDLLVVNAGDPSRNVPDDIPPPSPAILAAAAEGLDRALERGMGVLATHTAVASLRDYPRWRRAIAGQWRVGISWHPPLELSSVRVCSRAHAITESAVDFSLVDEMYSGLEVDDGAEVLAEHVLDGVAHPLVWAVEAPARATVVALGHDGRAYESIALRELLRRAARWAARLTS